MYFIRFKKYLFKAVLLTVISGTLFIITTVYGKNAPKKPPYLNPKLPINVRADDLLSRMTIEEKVGHLNIPWAIFDVLGTTKEEKVKALRELAQGTYLENFGPVAGFFVLPNHLKFKGPKDAAEFINELQKIALTKTRLGIPLLQTEEGTHGVMCPGATIFPEGPGLGSIWNLELISKIYAAIAKEARSIGIHQLCTLVIEPIRDPRLGRNEETFSEDPFLTSQYAKTLVKAIQGDDISASDKNVAVLCHFPGQSQPTNGIERGEMQISERVLRETFLPPWEAGIKKSGALGVMATYPAIDGVPVHSSERILTGILREELRFKGVVLSEGEGISTLLNEGIVATAKEAGQICLKSGVDLAISWEPGYLDDMTESVKEEKVSMAILDRAVRRVLVQKFKLGLFENPYIDPEKAEKIVRSQEHQEIALQAARESVVLLKNQNNLLPLHKNISSIAVIGPNADHVRNQLGDYTSLYIAQPIITVLKGIRNIVSKDTKVTYVKGCDIIGNKLNEIEKARQAAKDAKVAIVVLGENEWQQRDEQGNRTATSGEGFDVASLDLTGNQQNLVKAVVETGTPTIVVLINGRPLSTRYIAAHVPAVLETWLSGEKGGQAIAEIIFGDINPSGKLPVTIPRHIGQFPFYYNAKKSKKYWLEKGWGKSYVDMDYRPLYPFGHGLSFTTFEYTNLSLNKKEIGIGGSIKISVDITNTGDRFGKEIVQLYIQDVLSSVSTPHIELKGFNKIALQPKETKTITFQLNPEHLMLFDRNLKRVVEPGEFKVMIGASSEDIRQQDSFWVK